MKQNKRILSLVLVFAMVLSLLVHTVWATGTVTVSYDTAVSYVQGDVALLTAAVDGIENVASVEFYDGTTSVGKVSTAPYTLYYLNLPAGERSITAKVTDSGNNITASDAVALNVLATPSTKTYIAGTDFTGYTGGGKTIANVDYQTYASTSTAVTVDGNTYIQCSTPATTGEAYRIYVKNAYTPLNTVNNKVEISMDMKFGEINADRLFLKTYGAATAAGVAAGTSVSFVPITFKADKTIRYIDSNGTSQTLKTNHNTGTSNFTLETGETGKWYTFSFVTWIDATQRYYEFYIDGEKAFDTVTIKNSGVPLATQSTMYYFRSGYVFANGSASSTLTGTTYFDNIYAYQYPATTIATTLTAPENGTRIKVGDPTTLTATAVAADSTAIQKVQYYNDGQLLGESTTAPYTVDVTLPLGTYNIVARSVAANGQSGYSASSKLIISANDNKMMRSSILETKNGAGAIVSMTYDDALLPTAEFNAQMFDKYNLRGTAVLIANSITSSNIARWTAAAAAGKLDYGSHSTSHAALTDNTVADSVYTYELDDSKTTLKTWFPNQDIITFAPSNNTMTTNGLVHVKNVFYAQRKGNRGYNSLSPVGDEWYDIKMQGIGDVSAIADRNAWVDNAIANGKWLMEMWHGIGEGGYQPQTKADAEVHYAYLAQKQNEGKIWNGSFTEVTKYIKERQVSTVEAEQAGDTVFVNLTYPTEALPADIFDYPLTVKVQVPEEWGLVSVNQGSQTVTVGTFSDNGVNSAYVSLVPNGGTAQLTSGGTSNKLTGISLNGTPIATFAQDTYSYDFEYVTSNLPITVAAVPLDTQATVTYSPSSTVTALPTTTVITVKDTNGAEQNYTINFKYKASDNNNLASISVNGTAISTFSADVTSYTAKAPYGVSEATVAAAAADSTASVSYSPAATVSVPGTVTITVTAETGAVKTYTVNVISPTEDIEYLDDNFEGYTLDQFLTTAKWSAFNNMTNNGTISAYDPLDASNKVGKCFNTLGSTQNQQLNRYLTKTTETVVVRGRYMRAATDVGSGMDILVRGEGTNLINICNFASTGDIKLGSNAGADAKYVVGKWIDYALVIAPVSGKYRVTGYFSGAGILDATGNAASVVVSTKDTASNSNTNMATLDCRILLRGNVATGADNGVYIDDVRIYIPGAFKLALPGETDIEATDSLTIEANHDIAPGTLTKDSITVKNAQDESMAISSVDVAKESFTVHFAGVLPGGNYKLTLADTVTDVIGQTANEINFGVLSAEGADPIIGLVLNTPVNLSQTFGATTPVSFVATSTPSVNVQRSTIVWYVNDVLQQGVTGASFNYQPTNAGDYVVTPKVSNNPDAVVESRTIHVEPAEAVVTSWPTIGKITEGQTYSAALGSDGVGDGTFTIADADVAATAHPEGIQKVVTFTPNDSNYKAVQTTVTVIVKELAQYLIDTVTLNTPANLNQMSDAISAVSFTAAPSPASGIDAETIQWYVNSQVQSVIGTDFVYTPATAGTYVVSTGVSNNPSAVCDSRTIVVSRNALGDDTIVINDDFSSYGDVGSKVVAGTWWNEVYNDATRGASIFQDPINGNNLVAGFWSTSTAANWPSMRKPVTLDKTIVFSGKVLIPTAQTTTYYLNYRYSGATNTTANIINFTNDATNSIKAGSGNTVLGYWKPGEWVKYTVSVSPNAADAKRCQLNVTLSGGVTDTSGAQKDISFISQSNTVVNLETIGMANQTLLTNASIPASSTEVVYLDDIKVYQPASLITRIDKKTDVATDEAVTVYFNHDIDVTTLTKDKVVVKDAQQNVAAVSSIAIDPMNPSSFVIHFEQGALAAGKTYTVTLLSTVSDVAGFHPENSSGFSTVASSGPAPAPNVTVDDRANTITGLNLTTMEYAVSIDGGTTYSAYTSDVPDAFGGSKMVKVRVKAAGSEPAGLDAVLTFTPNQGDVSGDGIIDISDVIMAAEIAVGNDGYSTQQIARANVSDKDIAIVDIADVVIIAERAVGGVATFPVDLP